MLPARQIGSNGTDATSVPEHTRASSARAAVRVRRRARAPRWPARGRTSRRGTAASWRRRTCTAGPAARQSSPSASSGRSTPTSGTPGKRSRTRAITSPSPTPTSRIRRGDSPSSMPRRGRAMKPRIMRCSIGLVDAVLVVRVAGGRAWRHRRGHAGGTWLGGLVARTTRSASRPTVIACSAANRISSVLAASRKSLSIQS